jgi:hypothetical protein
MRRWNEKSMGFTPMLKSVFAAFMLTLPGLAVAQEAPASRPAITGISHVTLFADDLEKSQQF